MKAYKRKRFDPTREDPINNLRKQSEMKRKMLEGGMTADEAALKSWEMEDPERAARTKWKRFLDYPGNLMFEGLNNPDTGLPYEGNNYWHALASAVTYGTPAPDVEDYMPRLPASGNLGQAVESQRYADMLSADSEARQIEGNIGETDYKEFEMLSNDYNAARQRGDEPAMKAIEERMKWNRVGQREEKRRQYRDSDAFRRFYGMGF